jgi:hypothetical protein
MGTRTVRLLRINKNIIMSNYYRPFIYQRVSFKSVKSNFLKDCCPFLVIGSWETCRTLQHNCFSSGVVNFFLLYGFPDLVVAIECFDHSLQWHILCTILLEKILRLEPPTPCPWRYTNACGEGWEGVSVSSRCIVDWSCSKLSVSLVMCFLTWLQY